MENFTIHRLSEDRLIDLQVILKQVFGKKISIKKLRHKYNTKLHTSFEFMSSIGYINEKPVSFYGLLPIVFTNGNEKKIMLQSVDSATVLAHRGKGLFYKLAIFTYQFVLKENITGGFGFYNQDSYAACKKIGWIDGAIFKRFHFKINTRIPLLNILAKYNFLYTVNKRWISSKLNKYESSLQIKNELIQDDFFGVDYSNLYLDYKNKFNLYIVIINQCKIWLKIDGNITIGAVENLNQDNFNNVIAEILLLAKKLKTKEVVFHIAEYHPSYFLFIKHHKSYDSNMLGFYKFNNDFDLEKHLINYADIDTFL